MLLVSLIASSIESDFVSKKTIISWRSVKRTSVLSSCKYPYRMSCYNTIHYFIRLIIVHEIILKYDGSTSMVVVSLNQARIT